MSDPQAFYKEQIERHNIVVKKLADRLLQLSVLRLVTFVGACWFIYQVFKRTDDLSITGALLCSISFIVCLRIALNLQDKKKLTEKLLWLNNNELAVTNGAVNGFDNGRRYIDASNYSVDLDIFGEGSLYVLLNRTTTSHGSDKLAHSLQHAVPANGIANQQNAVRVMAGQPAQRQLITAHGLLHVESEGTLHDIKTWLAEPNRLLHLKWLQVARFIVPVFNLWAFYYFLDTDNQGPLLIGLAVAWLIIARFSGYVLSQHKLITKKQSILDQYAAILKLFQRIEPAESGLLTKLREDAADADHGIYRLARLSSLFDQRLNLIVFVVLNGFFLYDIQCMLRLEQWKSSYKSNFDSWIITVGHIELLNSLASFAFNNNGYTYPLVNEAMYIIAKDMSHPLIRAEVSVANSIILGQKEKLVVLTGSNMSGKTTFLRTLGVNLVLAQCGAPVNARDFSFHPMVILSSIRVGDSLQENTSYFMAELKKLRRIIDVLQTGQPALVLIDEILRGTNSDDKTHGSEQFIRKLIEFNCLTLFATHDLSLSALGTELSGSVSNYCFESVINDGQLLFDYTLQPGVARNKNASFLMEKMGII
jgi:MutS-like protein